VTEGDMLHGVRYEGRARRHDGVARDAPELRDGPPHRSRHDRVKLSELTGYGQERGTAAQARSSRANELKVS
jgi:hypothetical protein